MANRMLCLTIWNAWLARQKRIREAAKSGALSDDERRRLAGDAALQMVELMEKLGFDDDDEEDEDEEE